MKLTWKRSVRRRMWRNLRRAWPVWTLVLGVAILGDLALAQPQPAGGSCTQTVGPTRALGLYKPGKPVSLEDGFRDPPPICRAQCWWQCLGSAWTKEELTRELEEFKAKGMGGVTIKDTLPMPRDAKTEHIKDVPYMSPEWVDLFAHIVAECGRLGLICRSRLGSGWNEGGPWVTPEMSSQELAFVESKPITGPGKYTGPIPTAGELPSSKDLSAGEAFVVAVRQGDKPQRIDVTAKVNAQRQLTWDVPEGTWVLVACHSTPSKVMNMSTSKAGAGRHHDHLSTAAADLHLENVAGKMLARLGTFDGTAFDGFNHDSWEIGTPTWTPGFRQAFLKRCGYDPAPFLPVLQSVQWKRGSRNHVHGEMEIVGSLREEAMRFLYDFRTTVSDLIVEDFYTHVGRWCREHHVAFEAQAGGPMFVPRDPIQAHGVADIPMGEFWGPGWDCVKLATSAAHAYGRRLTGLESLTDTTMGAKKNHLSTPPSQMKQRIDNAFILGGNYLTMAVVEYSPPEAGLPGWVHNCGPHLNHCQTWWPLARAFYDYLGRCCFLLQSGKPVADVAIYHTFRTARDFRWHEPGDKLTTWPKEFSFDYVNDDLVSRHMSVRDGRIVLDSGASYEMLCIEPTPSPTMPLATLRKIRDLVRQGATVVWLAKPPAQAPGLVDYPRSDAEFQAILRELEDRGQFKHMPTNYAELVPIVQAGRNPPAWRTASESPLRVVHRRTATAEIFFLANLGQTEADAPVTFRVTGRRGEIWDPESGSIRPIVGQTLPEGVSLPLRVPAGGSTFVVFREGGLVARPSAQATGSLPSSIRVDGPWNVAFPADSGAPTQTTFAALAPWNASDDPAIRHFSGIAEYRGTLVCPADAASSPAGAVLDLGRVAEVCEVRLNGKLLGVRWHSPYRFDVTGQLRPGENHLQVRVANLWHNRLVGDAPLPPEQRKSRMMSQPDIYKLLRGKPLMDSGLVGPVQVVFER